MSTEPLDPDQIMAEHGYDIDEVVRSLSFLRARVQRAQGEIDSALSCVGHDVLVEGHLDNARAALAGDTEGKS